MFRIQRLSAFTIIELLVIISVIGTLGAVGIVSYESWQQKLAKDTVKNELLLARTAMISNANFKGNYPNTIELLNKTFKPSVDVTMSLTLSGSGGTHYSNLSTVQNGALFHEICGQLINEGYGKGTNNGGQSETYISACNVYNNPEIQVNSAWNGRTFTIPITSSALPNVVSSINYTDSYRPLRTQIEKDFYQTWNTRFLSTGGTYPVTSFWDPWANQWAGVPKPSMPTPDEVIIVSDEDKFCIEASHHKYPQVLMHITSKNIEGLIGLC